MDAYLAITLATAATFQVVGTLAVVAYLSKLTK